MPNENEYLNPYTHIGEMHNEGVKYVTKKLLDDYQSITKNQIINFTAEYMYMIDCCDYNEKGSIQRDRFLKIKQVVYAEFLYNLHNILQKKSLMDLVQEANLSAENVALIEMIFNNANNIDESYSLNPSAEHYPVYQMLDFVQRKVLESSANENEKRTIGVVCSVTGSSIEYWMQIMKDPKLKKDHEKINLLAQKDKNIPLPVNKFSSCVIADAKGALGGLISGGIAGVLGGPVGAGVGGLFGAVGGAASNSVIESIPAFNNKE